MIFGDTLHFHTFSWYLQNYDFAYETFVLGARFCLLFRKEISSKMEVIGAGMGRTGTSSLQAALQILGKVRTEVN